MKEIRLSQCMIVKNEEGNLHRALSWGKRIVWEQIVVDTGSSDRTVELAKELGAKVFHFPWCDDFSAAKNYALEQAKGDWIVFLDADEYFEPECAGRILGLIRHAENDFPAGRRPDLIRAALQNLDDSGRTFIVGEQDRIFRNRPDIRYRGTVHETLHSTTRKPLFQLSATDRLSIMHTGYKSSVIRKKGERNLPLLQKQAEREPENPQVWCYLAESLAGAGRIMEARLSAERALSLVLEPESIKGQAGSAAGRPGAGGTGAGGIGAGGTGAEGIGAGETGAGGTKPGEAKPGVTLPGLTGERFGELCALWFTLAKDEAPQTALDLAGPAYRYYGDFRRTGLVNPDVEFAMGNYLAKVGLKEDAVRILEGAFETLEHWQGGSSLRLTGGLQRACNFLAACALEQGQKGRAVSWLTLSLRTDRYQEEALAVLIGLFRDDPNTSAEQAAAFLGRLYHLDEGKERIKDRLFVLKAALAKEDRELAKVIRRGMTEEELSWLDAGKEKPWQLGKEELEKKYPDILVKNRTDRNFLVLMEELVCRPEKELGEGEYGEATAKLLKAHREELLRLYAKLGDYRSRQVLYGVMELWLSRERRFLELTKEGGVPFWDPDLIPTAKGLRCVSVGGRLRESTEGFLYCYEDLYESLTCFSERAGEEETAAGEIPAGAGKAATEGALAGTAKAAAEETPAGYRGVTVRQAKFAGLSLDEAYPEPIGLLRLDAGPELLSLVRGAKGHIRKEQPKLLLSVEKNLNNLYELPGLLWEWNPDYRLYLRCYGAEQAKLLVLFAV